MGKRPGAKSRAAPRAVFETVPLSSDSLFQRAVSILHTSYLDSASEHGFQYSQVTLVKNDIFLNEYKTFYQVKKARNYTQEELQETYGFLLFETEEQAKLVCQHGLCVSSSDITTLGDPAKGVYISKYSDYLQARPWYHGKSGYIVIFNLIKGKVKFVPENYTTNYTSPSVGYDCHVAANTNKVSHKTSHFRTFELSQYYLYELTGSTITKRPRQVCPYLIVAFQYQEPKRMATLTHQSLLELHKNVLTSPWKGKLILQGYLLCDITLRSSCGTVIPIQLPHDLDFKYVMKVSSLKQILPQAVFKKQNNLEQKAFSQEMCFSIYEVELSNKEGGKINELTEYIKNEQLAIIKCLEDRGFFILLMSSALIAETTLGEEQMSLCGLHVFHSSLPTGMKDLKVEEDISLKVLPILPALNCALLEAKKLFTEEGICPNTLVKRNLQDLCKAGKSPQDGMKEMASLGEAPSASEAAEKCPLESLSQLRSYLSDPSSYILEVSAALDFLTEPPQSPCVLDGICDAEFSLVMTPDPEFLESEVGVRKKTEKNSEEALKARQKTAIPAGLASNVRVQPKRKASTPSMVQSSKRRSLCRPLPKRTPAAADKTSDSPATLKLVKGPFPQKRKRGAEVLTAQFVQTARLDRKDQDDPISKAVPAIANAKRARKQDKSLVTAFVKTKLPVQKSPQKQRINTVRGNQNPRFVEPPPPAIEETTSHLQSESSSDVQADVTNTNSGEPENVTVAPKDLPENIVSCDSQALNMLADLALSSAPSAPPPSSPRSSPCSPELTQNGILSSKEHSLRGTSDHEYHRGVRSPKSGLLTVLPTDEKSLSVSDHAGCQEEERALSGCQGPSAAPSALTEERLETSPDQNSVVAVEHSYALLHVEHLKQSSQQRGVVGPGFTKTGTKGPEAGTPVGKVMPFRHQQIMSPLQKLPGNPLLKRKTRSLSSNPRDFCCSRTVFNCEGSFKVTFKCEPEYAFNLDSKYTNNPLEKTVLRALHGPWNTNLPDNVEEVKLLLHMWVALFYSSHNKILRSSRRVVEHSNPAKYVSINSTVDSFELSESEDPLSVDTLLEDSVTPRAQTTTVFPDTNTVLPLLKPPSARGLGLWVQNDQEEAFTREAHPDTPQRQSFVCSRESETIEEKDEQESSDKLETSNFMFSNIGSSHTSIPSVLGEDRPLEPLDSARVVISTDDITRATAFEMCSRLTSQSVSCDESGYSTLETPESQANIFQTAVQTDSDALQGLIPQNGPSNGPSKDCESPLEKKDGSTEYVVINLEPITLTFEKHAYVPIQTEIVNRTDIPATFNLELIKQKPPSPSITGSVSFEKAQTENNGDIRSLAVPGQIDTKFLCAFPLSREPHAEEICSVEKEVPVAGASLPPASAVLMEALSLAQTSKYLLPREETNRSRDLALQSSGVLSISSEEIIVPSQVKEVSVQNHSLNHISSNSNTADGSLELRNDNCAINSENVNFESVNLAFAKQSTLSLSKEISLELSEEDSDINLTLTVSPPPSPREAPCGKVAPEQQDLFTIAHVQHTGEENIKPEGAAFRENIEVNSSSTSMCPVEAAKPLENKEQVGNHVQPLTVVLPQKDSTLDIVEEIRVPSDFPFGSLIEEVSPASSPAPRAPVAETQPAQASIKYPCIDGERNDRCSQFESGDSAINEENVFISPTHPVAQHNLTQVLETQPSAEKPLLLYNHPEGKERHLTIPSSTSEEIAPGEPGEGIFSSEQTQGSDLATNHIHDLRSSLKMSRDPLWPIHVENRNPDLNHPVFKISKLPFSPQRRLESKTSTDTLTSTAAPSNGMNTSSEPQMSLKSMMQTFSSGEGNYIQVRPFELASADGGDSTQTHEYSERPQTTAPSDGAPPAYFPPQEVAGVRMSTQPKSTETEVQLQDVTDGGSFVSQTHTTVPKGGQVTSVSEIKDPWGSQLIFPGAGSSPDRAISSDTVSSEPSASSVPKSSDTICGVSEEQTEGNGPGERPRPWGHARALSRDLDVNANSHMHREPSSGDSDAYSPGAGRKPKSDLQEPPFTLRCNRSRRKEEGSAFQLARTNDRENWGYSKQIPGLETSRNGGFGLKKDKCAPRFIQIRDVRGIPRTYANFTITKECEDASGTRPQYDLLSSWVNTWQAAGSLTQRTVDLEYLRFAHKLKQIVKNRVSRHSVPATSIFPKESSRSEAFPLTKTPEGPCPMARSRSPLMVTIVHPDPGQCVHARGHLPTSGLDSFPFWKERSLSRKLANPERKTVSFHLNKLKYNSTLKDPRNDISLILNEYTEFNKVMVDSNQVIIPEGEPSVASGGTLLEEMCSSFPRRCASYEDMITDLCASLHIRLKSVMKEARKNTFLFYLVETEDKSFFLRTKNILRKGGHKEIEPQHFCQTFHRENDTLIIIIRNEDIASHLHQIPSLLKLKHFPNVLFAGIDSPEDVLDYTYQELFPAGGFVVSDDRVLEMLTLVQLKEVVKILEKLNGNGRWKWFLHYREQKKLKEDVRVDSTAHKKNLILKSCQSANLIESLHYHQCDSQQPAKGDYLQCLRSLQVQHICSRFAIFLTEKPAGSREVFENSGILVTDVKNFIENIQKVAAPFRSSYW
ncbi:protein TASOR 2 [Sorex fumeus]|uniref:protein TASOR 2 n=1 Tax=Sorex fumeus TaxID=62283 RepID=UPI0024ACA32D|nr:protein TASOR 2 [Sorex fumeus]